MYPTTTKLVGDEPIMIYVSDVISTITMSWQGREASAVLPGRRTVAEMVEKLLSQVSFYSSDLWAVELIESLEQAHLKEWKG